MVSVRVNSSLRFYGSRTGKTALEFPWTGTLSVSQTLFYRSVFTSASKDLFFFLVWSMSH